jgi:agmatine deiminase
MPSYPFTQNNTPRSLGYRMPAEWHAHAATWIAWPHNASDWPGKFQPIPWVYAEIVRHLSRVEEVHILVKDVTTERRAQGVLARNGVTFSSIHFHHWPTDRVWTRDSGPIFLRRTEESAPDVQLPDTARLPPLAITNWKFNAWAKYDDWQLDDAVPGHIALSLDLPEWTPEIMLADGTKHRVVLEGGSIDTNGAGVLLTTEECLLGEAQQRNPSISREQLEQCFHDYLGMDQVLWLGRGITGDDTHGHIDDLARFTDEATIVTVVETNKPDENYVPLQENLDRLKNARTLDGRPFRIVELPMPAPVVFDGQRLPASYANFYIANGLVLAPTFNDPKDRIALDTLASVFPKHEIVGIHCVDLIWGLGALHCMTQQQPL